MSGDNIVEKKVIYTPESAKKDFDGTYEKYLEKLFRIFKDDARATRPDVVGQLTDLLEQSSADTYSEWEEFYRNTYLDKNPNAIQNSVDMIIEYLGGTINKRIKNISRDDVKEWIQMLLYYRSPTGMFYEKSILKYIADEYNMEYTNSSSKEEVKSIDGYIGKKEVQVKPQSYNHGGTTRENPSIPTIEYCLDDDIIIVNTEELSIINKDKITVGLENIQEADSDNKWRINLESGYEKIINNANETARANRKGLVGDISQLTDMCPYNNINGWVEWYQNKATKLDDDDVGFKTPKENTIQKATDETYEMIQNWKNLTDDIEDYRNQIESMVWRLIIFETHDGLSVEKFVFRYLSDNYDLSYRDSTSKEESKNIDGYLDDIPVQVKPESYDRVNEGLDIDPVIVRYKNGRKYITLKYNESNFKK